MAREGADRVVVEDGDAEMRLLGEDMRHELENVELHRPLVRERWLEGHGHAHARGVFEVRLEYESVFEMCIECVA